MLKTLNSDFLDCEDTLIIPFGTLQFICSLFHVLSVKTNSEEFLNLKRAEKKIEKSSIKPIIGFDQEDMK